MHGLSPRISIKSKELVLILGEHHLDKTMQIEHHYWGILIKLPEGGEIEIHNTGGGLDTVTINGIKTNENDEQISRDITFSKDGKILADGFVI